MIDILLKRLVASQSTPDSALAIANQLITSGIGEFVRAKGNQILTKQTSTVEEAALLGARAAGWQECLDLILNFNELVIRPTVVQEYVPRADFGSLEKSLAIGDLTKEEVDAIRRDTKPIYPTTTIKSS